MNIGRVSAISGLPTKTIRYYEDIKLVKPARSPNGYRDYSDTDTNTLVFLKRARGLGFTIEECRSLLSLYQDKERASSDVKSMALDKIGQIESRIHELNGLKKTLYDLAENCHGDNRPDCPILDELSGIRETA
jgi:MerR family copper efflux transcriptional regulator